MGKIGNNEGNTVWERRKEAREKGKERRKVEQVEQKRRKANILGVEEGRKKRLKEGKMKR